MKRRLAFLGWGIFFGFTLSRVGASEYDLIYNMFAGIDLKLAWVMISAMVVGNLGMRWLHARGDRGYQGMPLNYKEKPLTRLTPLGGTIFGIGWAMAGACPGTALAQVGEGKLLGLFTVAGIILGTYLYALLAERFDLP